MSPFPLLRRKLWTRRCTRRFTAVRLPSEESSRAYYIRTTPYISLNTVRNKLCHNNQSLPPLPPAYVVCGKVLFSFVSVSQSVCHCVFTLRGPNVIGLDLFKVVCLRAPNGKGPGPPYHMGTSPPYSKLFTWGPPLNLLASR